MKKILALLTCAAGALKVREQFGRPSTSTNEFFMKKNMNATYYLALLITVSGWRSGLRHIV